MTSENQKIIIIHKDKVKANFMQLELSKMYAASCDLNESQFKLFLYLCGNADNFHLELSQVRFSDCMGIKRTAYYTAVETLIRKGYLVLKHGNVYDFYTTPQEVVEVKEPVLICFTSPQSEQNYSNPQNGQNCPQNEQVYPQSEQSYPQSDGQIDKYIITDNNIELATSWRDGVEKEEGKAVVPADGEAAVNTEEPSYLAIAAEIQEKQEKAKAKLPTIEEISNCSDKVQLRSWMKAMLPNHLANAVIDRLYS